MTKKEAVKTKVPRGLKGGRPRVNLGRYKQKALYTPVLVHGYLEELKEAINAAHKTAQSLETAEARSQGRTPDYEQNGYIGLVLGILQANLANFKANSTNLLKP